MKGLTVTKQIALSLSADDWELYRSADQWELYTTIPGRALDCELAAHAINKAIEDAFNGHETRIGVEKIALETMRKYSDLGAMDSEPIWVLARILEKLYSPV